MFPSRQQPQRLWLRPLLGALGGVVVTVIVVCAWLRFSGPRPDAKSYQAVFLANGQVYFGKLHGIETRTPVLDDVFYLQANDSLQKAPTAATGTPETANPQFSLIKLGQTEIHAPQDRIFLFKEQLLFWENLKADSQVIKTINEYHQQPTQK
ncbi:hypothetical protein KBD18_01560 [Patescibacteria group bacterium]|nr:hypothetical protein [Patescibacteria group bacterium]